MYTESFIPQSSVTIGAVYIKNTISFLHLSPLEYLFAHVPVTGPEFINKAFFIQNTCPIDIDLLFDLNHLEKEQHNY